MSTINKIFFVQFVSVISLSFPCWVACNDCGLSDGITLSGITLSEWFDSFPGSNSSIFCSCEQFFTCSNGKVLALTADNKGITGTIPPNVASFSDLTSLKLDRNALTGSLPSSLGNLSNLLEIMLSQNELNGTVPPSLGSLQHLTQLKLKNNELSGPLPASLGSLSRVKTLDLSGNNELSGPLPPSFESLQNLTQLRLGNNELSGPLPASLGSLSRVKTLDLCENGFTGILPFSWGNMTDLEELYLNDNYLSGILPQSWAAMSYLNIVYLSNNVLEGTLPQNWSSMSVQRIELQDNHLEGTLPFSWGNMTDLVILNLNGNYLSGILPQSWAAMNSLRYLYLDNNVLEGSLPQSWSSMNALKQLHLDYNNLSGMLPVSWAVMTALQKLYLDGNLFNGTLPQSWASMISLNTLWLGNNTLTGGLPESWGHNLTSVTEIDLPDNMFTGILPDSWSSLLELKLINLANSNIQGTLPSSWSAMIAITSLNLENNDLSGLLPPSWSSMSSMTDFNLCKNSFNGTIPNWTWPSLEKIDVHANTISGTIPPFVSQILDYVSLAQNLFTGTVPVAFSNLLYLQVLDISQNELSGNIPDITSPVLKALLIYSNEFTSNFFYPSSTDLSVLVAHTNFFSDFDDESWCANFTAGIRCDLSGMQDPHFPCSLTCSNKIIDVASHCGVKCSCPSLNTSTQAFDVPNHVMLSSCSATLDGQVCEYGCENGFTRGVIEPDVKEDCTAVASCNGGNWSFVSRIGEQYGCLEKNCVALTAEDVPHAALDKCSAAPYSPNDTCHIECSSGYKLVGPSEIQCTLGQWNTSGTSCENVQDIYSNFDCQGLMENNIPNIEDGSCRGTLGRSNTGYSMSDSRIYDFIRDYLDECFYSTSSDNICMYPRGPGLCNYTCLAGYYPNPDQTTVECELGKWVTSFSSDDDISTDEKAAWCQPKSCDEFWTQWSSCSGFCEDHLNSSGAETYPDLFTTNPGVETRTFIYSHLDIDDVQATMKAFNCLSSGDTNSWNMTVENRSCTNRDRCCVDESSYISGNCNATFEGKGFGILECSMFWSQWSSCSELCGDGNKTRTFAKAVYEDSSVERHFNDEKIIDFMAIACGSSSMNETQDQNCNNAECSEIVGIVIFVALVVGVGLGVGIFCYLRRKRVINDLKVSKIGRLCVSVCEHDTARAMTLLSQLDSLKIAFRGQSMQTLWFVLNEGKRSMSEAKELIQFAKDIAEANEEISFIAALEIAEWKIAGSDLPPLHQILFNQVHDHKMFIKCFSEKKQFSDADPSYFHIVLCTRWGDVDNQLWTIQYLLDHLPDSFKKRLHVPRPLLWNRDVKALNILEFGLERNCDLKCFNLLLQHMPALAECCKALHIVKLVELHCKSSPSTAAEIISKAIPIRLNARIKNKWWENDENDHHGFNGFTPPHLKLRELKHVLHDCAEIKLSVRKMVQALTQKRGNQDLSSEFIGESWMDCRIDALTKESLDKTHLLISTFSTVKLNQVIPLQIQSKRSRRLSQVIRKPWSESFIQGLLRPILDVVRDFLQQEIEWASSDLEILDRVCTFLVKGFKNIYSAIANKFIESDPHLSSFKKTTCVIFTAKCGRKR